MNEVVSNRRSKKTGKRKSQPLEFYEEKSLTFCPYGGSIVSLRFSDFFLQLKSSRAEKRLWWLFFCFLNPELFTSSWYAPTNQAINQLVVKETQKNFIQRNAKKLYFIL
jgi:hypothetical protein